jgi:ArsR family transcriptional regulator, arsenate/arsenite/antimonite-responsive transcriptional repressor
MIERRAILAFAALAQDTRLRILRLLVKAGEPGIAAGKIAAAVGASASNASHHLGQLENAGLIVQRREARSIVYSADYETLGALIGFLMKDCCGGKPEICEPAISAACCRSATKREAVDG